VQDPLVDEFRQVVRDAGGDPGPIADGFLDLLSVFGTDLVAHYAFREAVRANVIALFRDGAKATLARHLGAA
jgi:fructuronate reductase